MRSQITVRNTQKTFPLTIFKIKKMISDYTSLSRLKPDVGLQPTCSASTQWELVSEQSVLQDETRPWTVHPR